MIGPQKQRMPDKKICTRCDVLISKEMGGTKKFPEKWVVYYCNHTDLKTEISFIKRNNPWTPEWCPALITKKTNQAVQGSLYKASAP